jgi:hypothetical protein
METVTQTKTYRVRFGNYEEVVEAEFPQEAAEKVLRKNDMEPLGIPGVISNDLTHYSFVYQNVVVSVEHS